MHTPPLIGLDGLGVSQGNIVKGKGGYNGKIEGWGSVLEIVQILLDT
jgi:hypothetical protein